MKRDEERRIQYLVEECTYMIVATSMQLKGQGKVMFGVLKNTFKLPW